MTQDDIIFLLRPEKPLYIFVPGYGIPKSTLQKHQYDVYADIVVSATLIIATRCSYTKVVFVLAGGPTDPKQETMTETDFLRPAIQEKLDQYQQRYARKPSGWLKIICIRDARDLRQGLRSFATALSAREGNDGWHPHIIVFCERSRRWRTQIIARAELPHRYFKVMGVNFEQVPPTWQRRVAQMAEILSAALSNAVPAWYEHVEFPRRLRKIRRQRE